MRGRARLRVPKPRTPGEVRRMAGRLARSKRVRNVESNPITGSLLVSFDPDDPIDMLIDDLRMIGLEVATMTEQSREVHTQSTGAVAVQRAIGGANAKLHQMTNGHVDLRLAVPAIYTALAIRNFVRHRARLRDASWYQLLYWAFDSFFKLHEEQTVRQAARSHGRVVN
jgi:hypothetical protein